MKALNLIVPRCVGLIVLIWSGAGQANEAQRQALRQFEAAEQQLQLASSPASMLKEITRDCVPAPISTTASGPSWTFEVQTGTAARLGGTAWRQPCAGNDAQLILTLQPLQGTPFVCGTEMEITIGAARTDDLFLDVNPNDGVGTSFCGNLASTTSFVIHEFDNAFAFDDDGAFTLVFESNVAADASVAIPAFDASLYGTPVGTAVAIGGKHSGSYFAAGRSGEGVLVEVGTIGTRKVLFLTWYTYFQGQQRWLFGSVDLAAGATSAAVPLYLTSGGQFGSAFNPAQVAVSAWGTANIALASCTQMQFAWSENGGGSGVYDYTRSMERLEGIACP
jgi:hypothetical protein